MTNICDKCGREVEPINDIRVFEAGLGLYPELRFATMSTSRHLLPVIEDGKKVCEGSPSRAQYLEGQPQDLRCAMFPYEEEVEKLYRQTFTDMTNIAKQINLVQT